MKLATLAALFAIGDFVAQAPADFSGTWSIAPSGLAAGTAAGSAPPGLSAPGDMSSGWGSDLRITQDASTLTVVYTYFHPREMQPPFTFTYALDGADSTNTVNIGRGPQEQASKASWQGAALVITTRHRFVNPQNGEAMTSETRQVLSLETPTRLVIETTRAGVLGGRASTTRTVYRKTDMRPGVAGSTSCSTGITGGCWPWIFTERGQSREEA
jgi:hypothetical protein